MNRSSAGIRRRPSPEMADSRDFTPAPLIQVSRLPRKGKGFAVSRIKKLGNVSSSSMSTSSLATENRQGGETRKVNRLMDDDFHDLALSLGMSFAAVLSQVLCGKIVSRDQQTAENLAAICTSAIKESLSNIYGDKFDSFARAFEKSFDSTLKTLLVFNKASSSAQKNRPREELIHESYNDVQGSNSCSSSSTFHPLCHEEPEALSSTNQLVLRGDFDRQIVRASHSLIAPCFNESILTNFEKSVTQQTRSNDLKEVEIGLTMRKLQMKQSQLAMNSYANWLGKVKICMNMSKAVFKEEKLRNQMLDSRHAELLRRCIDLLVSGLVLMCCFLGYGVWIFSYQRITEATSSCTEILKESKSSWWKPKPIASFTSGWQMLRCYALIITRMLFGLLIILVIACSLLRRSAVSGPATPITSILLLLGVACGIAGKLCVDSLGGSGYQWLVYWEALCSIHFFVNIFPSIAYRILHGRVSVVQGVNRKTLRLPYWIWRYAFYGVLLLVLPASAGLLPFASLANWKDHFGEKSMVLFSRIDYKRLREGLFWS